jgi:biotin-dependent carboxylase-like uncharacterized protein
MISELSVGLRIHRITMLCQLQDLGRSKYQEFGVNRCGAMDPYSLRLANILAGNPQGTACLEFALAGAIFEVTADSLRVAFIGEFPVKINGEIQAANASHFLQGGDRLEIGATTGGIHGYLAVSGGFSVKPQLGSCSTHLRTGLGGFGQPVAAGSILPLNLKQAPATLGHFLPPAFRRISSRCIRVVRGPQSSHFTESGLDSFFNNAFRVRRNSDRMGYRLGGNIIEHSGDGNIISEPVLPGCVQVPAGGEPIVLMADCGTVGGYPKIATVISVDLGQLAQFAPGTEFIFDEVSVEESQGLLREQEQLLVKLADSVSRI